MQYVKIINKYQISFPENVKGNVSNYHLCPRLLSADGFKPLDASEPLPSDGSYLPTYEETEDKIVRHWEKQIVPEPTYYEKRAAAYPPVEEYLDAQVKINSGDADMVAAGQAQLEAYYQACLAVKAKYPKREETESQDNV